MNVLIVSATSLEIEPTLNVLGKGQALSQNNTRYKYNLLVVDVLITGVGMVATSYWMGKAMGKRQYHVVINAGICGSFNRTLALGDVVNVVEDSFPEKGAESGEYFLSLVDLKLLERDEFPFTDGKLVNTSLFKSQSLTTLPRATSVTVNTVHGNSASISRFRKRTQADVETMEGAAFFYVAFQERIPCLQLRAISNYVESRDTSNWNIPLAIRNLNQALLNVLLG